MKVAVIGTGFVAQAYLRCLHYLGYHPLVLSRSWIDYTAYGVYGGEALKFCLKGYQPDVVINCAGFTGKTVDDCEINFDVCKIVNDTLPYRILDVVKQIPGCRLIHISTGCMFNGSGPFTELDKPNFLQSVYAKTKRDGERWLNFPEESWIFRIRMPFSHVPHRRNWLCKLQQYDHILDGLNSVTWIDEFAMRSWQICQKAPPGIYHSTQKNPVRTIDVAWMLKPDVKEYHPVDFIKTHIPRSAAVLDSSKFEQAYGTEFTDSGVALRWCIDNLGAGDATSPP